MRLLLLLCALGAVVSAPTDSSDAIHYDTIVVGLGAAGTTAATELARAGKRVLALEAQSRVGGRVYTVPLKEGLVEVGAEWIHGSENSRTYNLATQNNITIIPQESTMEVYRSDGSTSYSDLVKEFYEFSQNVLEDPPETPEPQGIYVTRKLMEYIQKNKPKLLNDQDFITEVLEFLNLMTNSLEASNDWNDVTTGGNYQELGGNQGLSWHRYGYKTFFEIMLNTYNGGLGLTNLDIKLNTEVTHITVPQHPNEKVKVECKDGSTYEADTMIVTVSLGVLKANHSTLFSTPLPKDKQTAIEKIGMGVVGKIILTFEDVWWPTDISTFGFVWKEEDKKKVAAADYWTTRILGAYQPMGSNKSLTLWTNGDATKEVEKLPEETVKTKSVELLQKFMGNAKNITVPQPSGIIRSTWYSNPYTRGTYSFDSLISPQYPDARAWLGSPLVDSSGTPRVLFAGEATNVNHFSTVHGASETGHREAERLLSSIYLLTTGPNHWIELHKPKIIATERHYYYPRMVCEAIEIKKHQYFNREDGFNLSPTWGPVIQRLQQRDLSSDLSEDVVSVVCRPVNNQ